MRSERGFRTCTSRAGKVRAHCAKLAQRGNSRRHPCRLPPWSAIRCLEAAQWPPWPTAVADGHGAPSQIARAVCAAGFSGRSRRPSTAGGRGRRTLARPTAGDRRAPGRLPSRFRFEPRSRRITADHGGSVGGGGAAAEAGRSRPADSGRLGRRAAALHMSGQAVARLARRDPLGLGHGSESDTTRT